MNSEQAFLNEALTQAEETKSKVTTRLQNHLTETMKNTEKIQESVETQQLDLDQMIASITQHVSLYFLKYSRCHNIFCSLSFQTCSLQIDSDKSMTTSHKTFLFELMRASQEKQDKFLGQAQAANETSYESIKKIKENIKAQVQVR
jgi:hypothetical protein